MKNKNKLQIKNSEAFFVVLFLVFAAGLFFLNFANTQTALAAITCDATFVPNTDGTKCECPAGKQIIPGTTTCGDIALYNQNKTAEGTPNNYDPNAGSASQGQNLFGRPLTSSEPQPQPKKFNYTLLESFPGFFKAGSTLTDLPTMILAIYKFGIWTVGIAGLFMLVVGGFMYMASAGNTSTAGNARGIIWDSLLGIVAALGAYLILYVINPELTKINLRFTPVEVQEIGPGPSTSGSGNCKQITTANNPCSVDNLKKFAQSKGENNPDDWAIKASSICSAESSGKSDAKSGGTCSGTPIAYGIFQINLNVECSAAFGNVKWSRSRTTDKDKLYDPGCKLTDPAALEKCKANALDVNWNLNKMYSLYKARGWQPWEVTLNGMCPKW